MNLYKEAHIVRRSISRASLIGGVALAAVVAMAIPAGAAITSPAANATVSGTVDLHDDGAQSKGCAGTFGNTNGSTNMYVDQGAGTAATAVVPVGSPDTGTSTVVNLGTVSGTGTESQDGSWITDNYGNGTYTVNSIEKNAKATVIIITVCSSGTTTNAKETVTVSNTGVLNYGGVSAAPQGTTLAAKATLTDQNGVAAPTGTPVSFELGGGAVVNTTTGAGGVANANVPVIGPPGVETLHIAYAGTFWNAAAQDVNFTVQADPTTTVISPTSSSQYGNTDTFTATVTSTIAGLGTPSGQVTFTEDGNPVTPSTLTPVSAGVATATFSDATLAAGSHPIGASYGGDPTFATSTATAVTQVVNQAPTSTVLSTSQQPSFFGEVITYTATVTATNPGIATGFPVGNVSFIETPTGGSSSPIGGAVTTTGTGNVSTATSSSISLLPAGPYSVVANFASSPTSNYASSSSTIAQTIDPDSTSVGVVSTLPTESFFGQSVQFTATVSNTSLGQGSPTGQVAFVIDAGTGSQINLSTNSLNGAGLDASSATSSAISNLSPGLHTVTVTYTDNVDGNYVSGSKGTVQQFVAPDPSTTTISTVGNANPSVFGQSVAFAATVTLQFTDAGTPTGIVLFFVNSSDPPTCDTSQPGYLATVNLVNGVATTAGDANLAVGNNTISACYATFNADISGSVTQDPQYVQVVNPDPTTTTLTSANTPGNASGPSVFGQPVTFTATVNAAPPGAGVPPGTVTFSDGSTVLDTETLSGGTVSNTASFTTSALSVGSHAINAVYNPTGPDFLGSQAGLNQTVNQATSSTAVVQNGASVQGQPVSFTATVTAVAPGAGTPTGTVLFEVNGANILGPALSLSGGTVTSPSISTLTPGTYDVTAIYSGDVNFLPSTYDLNQIVNPASTSTSLVASPSPDTFGTPVTLTATVTPTGSGAGLPTGTVDFYDGTTLLGAAAVSTVGGVQQAVLPANTFDTVGNHVLSAVYLGEYDYAGSTSANVTESVQLIGTTTTVASSLNPSAFGSAVTFTATIVPASNAGPGPSGAVTFKDGSTVIGTGTVASSGGHFTASLTLSSLAVGSHGITASYSGATSYSASASGALTQTVNKAATSIAAQQATASSSMTATLSSAQGPIAGQTLTFTAGTTVLCTAVTGTNGSATCTATGLTGLTLDLNNGYKVTYAGNGSYLGSSASAGVA
jgi:hypothetical protein